MSVQFGRWNLDNRPVDERYLHQVSAMIAPYCRNCAVSSFTAGSTALLSGQTRPSVKHPVKAPPIGLASGAALTWDGRLDNRRELARELTGSVSANSTDLEIVGAAVLRWGTKAFPKLLGDWALAIWNPQSRSVILAKDFLGTRHLYYSADEQQISWCTALDPLVLVAGKQFRLQEEYIAGWVAQFPATHLTPYIGIQAVPPGCFVELRHNGLSVENYWSFDPSYKVRYKTDSEYEIHFREVFSEAVRRRLRSESPVLAELSGGIDSSSIVCMADCILSTGTAETPRLDTVSYFDDTQPHWNERPYFTRVEEFRGRIGCHIDVSVPNPFEFAFFDLAFPATPGHAAITASSREGLREWIETLGAEVLLSGIGGDEVAGGVPTATPELANLIVTGHFLSLAHHLKPWALSKRKPWYHLLANTLAGFCPSRLIFRRNFQPVAWLQSEFTRQHLTALLGYPVRLKLFGPLPSFQENLIALDALRRQISSCPPASRPHFAKTYPYLDRDLLEFLYAIPRDQIVRPGEKRSLIRRALKTLVPSEILNRKRKAFLSRNPVPLATAAGSSFWNEPLLTCSLGFVHFDALSKVWALGHEGREIPIVPLKRTVLVEQWLRELRHWNVMEASGLRTTQPIHWDERAGLASRAVPAIPV